MFHVVSLIRAEPLGLKWPTKKEARFDWISAPGNEVVFFCFFKLWSMFSESEIPHHSSSAWFESALRKLFSRLDPVRNNKQIYNCKCWSSPFMGVFFFLCQQASPLFLPPSAHWVVLHSPSDALGETAAAPGLPGRSPLSTPSLFASPHITVVVRRAG